MKAFATDWKFWVLTVVGVACAALTGLNISLQSAVRARQTEVATRQQFINDSVTLGRINSQLIQALANVSAQSNDQEIRDMLARHGVTFSINAPAASAAAPGGTAADSASKAKAPAPSAKKAKSK